MGLTNDSLKKWDIVSMGEIDMDLYQGLSMTSDDFVPEPGGSNATSAAAAAKLGARSAFIGKVGEDAYGIQLREALRSNGVDTTGLRVDPGLPTTSVHLTLEQGKPASYRFHRQFGADLLLWEEDLDKAMIQSTRVLLLSSLLLVSEPSWEGQWLAVEEAGQSGELVCFDLNHRPGLWPSESDVFVQLDAMLSCTDILKVNESELLLLTGTKDPSHGIPRLLERGVKLAAVTLGERRSYYGTQRIQGAVPAYRVDAVDPLGCGDIFTAALLVRLLEHNKNLIELTQAELEDCFRFANAAGALAATKRGTITAAPDRSEVEALLSK